jgi:hypothetical protein
VWYADEDGDGFGTPDLTRVSCEQPVGFVASNTDCDDGDPTVYPLRPSCPVRTALASCREIVAASKSQGDGAYEVDLDGAGPGAPETVWCDMTTDGGGWMALINPDTMPTTMGAGATFAGATVGGTTNSCTAPPGEIIQHGWRGLNLFRCGDTSAQLAVNWPNPVGATDVMFIATAQGQNLTLTIDDTTITASGSTTDAAGARCGFWNGSGATAATTANGCWVTYLNAPPLLAQGTISSALTFEITAGPACAPTCVYGVGMNLQKLLVR